MSLEASFQNVEASFQCSQASFRMLKASFQILEASFQIPEASFQAAEASVRILEANGQIVEASFQMLEASIKHDWRKMENVCHASVCLSVCLSTLARACIIINVLKVHTLATCNLQFTVDVNVGCVLCRVQLCHCAIISRFMHSLQTCES